MLLRFRVSNYRSLRDEQELSMVASSLDDPQGAVVDALGLGVLPVAAIYGANAAGKSNVLGALEFMSKAVVNSHRGWAPEGPSPVTPFLLDPARSEEPSSFEVDFILAGVRYRYGFVLDQARIQKEWLSAYPNRREQVWFVRDSEAKEPFEFGKQLKGSNRTIAALTRLNSLFLSAAAENNQQMLLPIYSWFSEQAFVHGNRGMNETLQVMQDERRRPAILEFLRSADLGIVGFRLKERDLRPLDRMLFHVLEQSGTSTHIYLTLELSHRAKSNSDVNLSLDQESGGTRAWISLLGPLLTALDHGTSLLVDELDASLHPHLALEVIRIFQDPARNPKHAQLIFNTHDTTLLGNLLDGPHLRRDQVWFVEKDGEGATHLYPLTDFKPRKDENLERGYLQGRYGAIPFIEPVPLVKGE